MNQNSKSQILNSKQILNTNFSNAKQYNLEERCLEFAIRVNRYIRKLPKDIPNIENGKQLARSSGSVGANYIEANESLSKKDFRLRVKISKKEVKESRFWLMLSNPDKEEFKEKEYLIKEATELMKIFGAILEKSK